MNAPDAGQRMIAMGRLHGAFGVRGELKLESFADPIQAIAHYLPWTLRDAAGRERVVDSVRVRSGAKGLIATIPGIDDREAAEAMRGLEVLVPRSMLPPPGEDEYYWVDLEGLRVVNAEGVALGTVSHLFATGANDVIVVTGERERLIPFLQPDVVQRVDFAARTMTVDWDADF